MLARTLYNSKVWPVVSISADGQWVKLATPLDGRGGGSLSGVTTIRHEHVVEWVTA